MLSPQPSGCACVQGPRQMNATYRLRLPLGLLQAAWRKHSRIRPSPSLLFPWFGPGPFRPAPNPPTSENRDSVYPGRAKRVLPDHALGDPRRERLELFR